VKQRPDPNEGGPAAWQFPGDPPLPETLPTPGRAPRAALQPRIEKAPDGLPWPLPRIAVDTSEQRPWAFGYVPAPWTEGAPVHFGKLAKESLVNERLGGPWHCERANLREGDYQLLGVDGKPIPLWSVVERKERDLVSSLTSGRDRLEAEMERLKGYRDPVLIASMSTEALLSGRGDRHTAGKEWALIGTLISWSRRYRIPMHLMADRTWAEYAGARHLLGSWREWLTGDLARLALVREATRPCSFCEGEGSKPGGPVCACNDGKPPPAQGAA